MPTSSAIAARALSAAASPICFCSDTSARCWSDLIAPSVLPRIVATSPFEKLKTNFSVSTCCCSGESPSIIFEHALAADRVHRLVLGGRLRGARRLGHLLLGLPAPVRAEVVHREVVRDPEEPRRERRRLPAEAADRLEHLHERLRGQVLGVVPVADAHVQVAVDAVEVEQVELLERVAVAFLRPRDEPP